MNIVEAFAYVITQQYGIIRDFTDNNSLFSIVSEIPNSLILNNDAIKELLSNLPQYNKHLIVHVGGLINEKRKAIKAREDNEEELNKQVYEDYENLKDEFGL